MAKTIKHADEIIKEIADALLRADGKTIEDIANQVLPNKVKYTEDSFFETEE